MHYVVLKLNKYYHVTNPVVKLTNAIGLFSVLYVLMYFPKTAFLGIFCNLGMVPNGNNFIISTVASLGYCLEVEGQGGQGRRGRVNGG